MNLVKAKEIYILSLQSRKCLRTPTFDFPALIFRPLHQHRRCTAHRGQRLDRLHGGNAGLAALLRGLLSSRRTGDVAPLQGSPLERRHGSKARRVIHRQRGVV